VNLHRTLLAACLLATSLAAHAQLSVVDFSSPPELVAREALAGKPGMAVAAVWRGGKLASAGLDGTTPLPAAALTGDTATLFEIGSISKVFTGLLLAQAVEAGELRLDDTLGLLLRDKVAFADPAVAAVTLRQLVTHTSCLPRLPAEFFRKDYVRQEPYARYDRARMWQTLGDQKLAAAPPCDASYSNFGFGILGEVLSERYGKPWETLVRERITQPLGMRNTMQTLGPHASRMAPAFSGDKRVALWDFQAFAGAGALRSTAEDLVVFGRALLAGRAGPLGAAAERVLAPLGRFDGDIGYAIFVRGPEGRRTYSHTGGTGGYRSAWVLAGDTGEVLVAIASNDQSSAYKTASDVLANRYPVPPAGPFALDPARLAEYSGVFREGRQSAWTFLPQDGKLQLRYSGQVWQTLVPSGPDTFNLGTMARLAFEREAGRIVAMHWTGRGAERRAARTDEPVPGAARMPQDLLQAYVGRYRTSRFDLVVTAADGQLTIQRTDQDPYRVYPVAGQSDRFAWDLFKAEAQFERYANGQVKALVLHQNGVMRAERVD
jgi:serine-type D-Ala-D-Ala carboxypeptidase/endopeptidase